MKELELMYEGKAKKVFKTDDEDLLIVAYKDDATAFNGLKKGTIVGKGIVNNRMSNYLCKILEEKGIPCIRKMYPGGHDWNVWRRCIRDFAQMIFRK